MPAPDLIAPDRLEELLGGALPEGEREARLQGLVRELRVEAPPAPPTLLERVREIGQEPPRRRRIDFLPRRRVLVLAALLVVLAAFAGLLSQVDARRRRRGERHRPDVRSSDAAGGADAPATPTVPMVMPRPAPPVSVEEAAKDGDTRASTLDRDTLGSDDDLSDMAPRFPSNRATDVKLWMEVRLADAEELSDAANDSMTITRELGGWVAGSEIDTQGNEGRAELALRVPVTRVEDAIVRLGEPRHRHRPAGRDRRPAGGHRPSRGPHRDPRAGDQDHRAPPGDRGPHAGAGNRPPAGAGRPAEPAERPPAREPQRPARGRDLRADAGAAHEGGSRRRQGRRRRSRRRRRRRAPVPRGRRRDRPLPRHRPQPGGASGGAPLARAAVAHSPDRDADPRASDAVRSARPVGLSRASFGTP